MVAVGVGSIAVDLQDVPNGPIRYMVNLFDYDHSPSREICSILE
jgi:hypothetical protein